jgi:hypothetical protein
LPTAAIQAFAGDVWKIENGNPFNQSDAVHSSTTAARDEPPFQLGRCHALRFDGPAVKEYYPRWFGHAPAGQTDTGTTVQDRPETKSAS